MSSFFKLVANLFLLYKSFKNRTVRFFLRYKFNKCGKNVKFDISSRFTFKTITIGNNVYIGPNTNFSSSGTYLSIGNKILFGPNVTIVCGNHNTRIIGKYMFDVHQKDIKDDLPVIIEDDVWIGANVIILKGVTIAKGSIIAAGSIVTKSTKPYSVNMGVPAKFYKFRWSEEDIKSMSIC